MKHWSGILCVVFSRVQVSWWSSVTLGSRSFFSLVRIGVSGTFPRPCQNPRVLSFKNKATVFLFLSFTCLFVFFSLFLISCRQREVLLLFFFFCFISPSHFFFFSFIWIRLIWYGPSSRVAVFFFVRDWWRDYMHRSVVVVCWSKMRNMRRYISDPHGSRSPSRGGGSLV